MTRDAMIERTVSAWRERRGDGGIVSSPAWHDLDDAGRVDAFEAAAVARTLEAALDPRGLSATAHAVLARLKRA